MESEACTFENHEMVQDILDSLTDGIFTIDMDWRITSFNRAAERITGHKAEEVLGRVCKEVFQGGNIHSRLCEEQCPMKRTLEGDGPVQEQKIGVSHHQGQRLVLMVTTSVLKNRSGEAVGGVEAFRDITEVEQLRECLEGTDQFCNLVGRSSPMQALFRVIEEVAPTDATVLLTGETGTGKDLVAQAIHSQSHRRDGPFVKINCAALPETLLESEFFGYRKGAFTGAIRDHMGRFERADGGTLFMDEVAEISVPMQAKLLRVLEEKRFERLGDHRTKEVDIRIIAATNQELKKAIEEGRFREDLYYRLGVIPIRLPTLAERTEDIPLLAGFFLKRLEHRYQKHIRGLSPDAMSGLFSYHWPGNVRELEHVLERAYVLCQDKWIRRTDVAFAPSWSVPATSLEDADELSLEKGERAVLEAAMRRFHWNRSVAAARLGVSRSTLWRKMKKHGLI